MPSILLTGGRVIDPANGRDQVADVAIENGLIKSIGRKLPRPSGCTVIAADGCIVSPGLIDPHVHLREPGQEHKETIRSGARSALAGGFTTVCCMPNTSPALDSPELVRFVYDRSHAANAARVFPVAASTRGRHGDEPTEIQLLSRAGAVAFSDDGECVMSAGVMMRIMHAVKHAGSVFMQHCQDHTLTRGGVMHAGEISARFGLGGWPRIAEEMIIERDVRLVAATGCRYHVQHMSAAGSADIVREARARKLPVTAEVSPHHLLLTDSACVDSDGVTLNTMAKMNPPLRATSDIKALTQAVADGVITVLATDHAPHSLDEKSLPFEEAPFGIVGLETALPLYIEALVTSGAIPWTRLIELMTIEPAKLCGLDSRGIGSLTIGQAADITVIDPAHAWTIDARSFVSGSSNTPFDGRAVTGRAIMTIVDGEIRHSITRG